MSIDAYPKLWGPLVNLQVDLIQMPQYSNFEYVLVILDTFSGQVEACPCKHTDATTVVKLL